MSTTRPEQLTRWLAERAAELRYADLTAEAVELVQQCVLDTLGVAIAGVAEPVVRIVIGEATRDGGSPTAPVIGHALRVPTRAAALVNGTAAHALDYDDNNLTMPGHVSAAVLPAVLALSDSAHLTGEEAIVSFAAGFETGCRLGATMSPGHYARGFHATSTHGTIAAAAAAARALRLDSERTAAALSIASTMAAGLKGLFGTMCKPLHAGRAAENGVVAAQLAAAGLEARNDAIECPRGYAATHAPSFNPAAAALSPPGGFHLRNNLFKFHAACYGTHGAIECARLLRERLGEQAAAIVRLDLETAEGNDTVCNIKEPCTAAEARFSLRQVIAMVLTGYDTSDADAFGGAPLADPETLRLRRATEITLRATDNIGEARLRATLRDGSTLDAAFDAGAPAADLRLQRQRLEQKFESMVTPMVGADTCLRLRRSIAELPSLPTLAPLIPTSINLR